ncbi:hypothetical protein DRE_03163 [Drechslerella stenobrocha 248]|uniref:NB-ARC domain-containing protein n=1 Tax=Drechslerella stenobrocha 248 TaxID=1043628 RepID=W7I5V4_9PEZI|nr:hypothetical protein DRE_03163 [Drechslerella stenobrocha 248]
MFRFAAQPININMLFPKAHQRFRKELGGDVDEKNVPKPASLEILIKEAQNLEANATRNGLSAASMQKLEPIISRISEFMATIALCEGAGLAGASGLIWGSLKMLLNLASRIGDPVEKVVYMLHDLSFSLPQSQWYRETTPLETDIENALIEVYTELLCFYARAIKFFRGNPHKALVSFSWNSLSSDFDSTLQRLRNLSKIADKEAEAARLRLDLHKNKEMMDAIQNLRVDDKNSSSRVSIKYPLYVIPNGINETFCNRTNTLEQLQKILNPTKSSWNRRAVLYGLGGVGKTKVALEYINRFKEQYDVVFWISSDSPAKMAQAFLQISNRLGPTTGNDVPVPHDAEGDGAAAKARVKDWLQDNPCRWLLVFDNVDDPDILEDAIPATTAGSIIVTSKDSSAGDIIGAEALHIKSFGLDEGLSVLKFLLKQSIISPEDNRLAAQLVERLGGLPLAIAQVSGYINQQRYSLKEFLPLYHKNTAKVNQKRVGKGSYDHTISTVWELDFERLPEEATTLRNLLAFLDPDSIHDSMILEGGRALLNDGFAFIGDEMDFAEAKTPLLRSALVDRCYETGTLSIHRLVQEAVIRTLAEPERTRFVDCTITLLSNSFPNSWGVVAGHQYPAWDKYEICLPHVIFLIQQCERWNIQPSDPKAFSELIFRMAWYLYEREQYDEARELLKRGLSYLGQEHELSQTCVLMLQGFIDLDTNRIMPALGAFTKALEIRRKLLQPNDEFIASSLNAISMAYTELGDIEKALKMGSSAIDIRLRNNSACISDSYSTMASTLLRLENIDEAEDMLRRCYDMRNLSDEAFLSTENINPRLSGDMVLLARIRQQQGRLEDALRLSGKALEMRQNMFGDGLRTCDSLYQVACLLHVRKDFDLSGVSLLDQSVVIADKLPHGVGYSARSWYKLSQMYREKGMAKLADEALMSAEALRSELSPRPLSPPSQEEYDKLALFMLW